MIRTLATLLAAVLLTIAAAQTVTVGLFQDPPNLDPARSTATSEYVVLQQIFDTLLTFDASGAIVPNLATDWTISDDGLVYTFTLRSGVRFHDGTPFDAEALKFSLDRSRTLPSGAFVEQLSNVTAVDVIDPTTVRITLGRPQGAFLTYLADRSSTPVSPTAATAAGDAFGAAPVGTGPFKFVSRVAQDNITLERNPDYWGGAPAIAQVIFKFFPDGAVRYANLRSGAVDVIYPIESRDYMTAQNDTSLALIRQPTNGWRILVMNTTKPPFDDVNLRRAVAAALDREAINQIVFNGLEFPAASLIPAGSPYFVTSPNALVNAQPEQAQTFARTAGAGSITPVLTTIARSPEDQLTQLIQAMAEQGGVNLRIDAVEVGEYQRRYGARDFEFLTMQWSGQADPDANVTSFLTTGGFWNWSGYSNPEVDALLAAAQTSSDANERANLYGQAMEIVRDEVPIVFMTNQVRLVGTSAKLTGVRLMPNTGILILKDAAFSN
jgi:peptide/nickel transport system substrate-binding protein